MIAILCKLFFLNNVLKMALSSCDTLLSAFPEVFRYPLSHFLWNFIYCFANGIWKWFLKFLKAAVTDSPLVRKFSTINARCLFVQAYLDIKHFQKNFNNSLVIQKKILINHSLFKSLTLENKMAVQPGKQNAT